MASSSKPRQPRQQRLRASCDGCFLAKVKCSKARPICSRCLACGIECRYSPSSRAGKPKSDSSASHHHGLSPGSMADLSPLHDDRAMAYASHPAAAGLYKLETGWHTPPGLESSMSRNSSVASGFPVIGMDEQGQREHDARVDMYGGGIPWSPGADFSAPPFSDMSMATAGLPPHHGRSASMDAGMVGHMVPPWSDHSVSHDMMSYGSPNSIPTPVSVGSHYFPSPSATPNMPHRQKPSSVSSVGGSNSCTCFTVCLQSLQTLHNASSPGGSPPFDVVLSLNRKAVEGCAAMLACPRCMNRSGTHTTAMLLATVIGKITSFYRNASQSYFENPGIAPTMAPSPAGNVSPGTGLGVSLGGYTLGGEDGRWLELEILNRELQKLQEVYDQFREVCGDLSEDAEVSKAMIGYLNNTLGSTLDVVSHRKGDVRYA